MLRRLYWIGVSYVTRPLTLAVAGVGLFFYLLFLALPAPGNPTYRPAYPTPPPPHLLIDSKATLNAVRASGMQRNVDAIDLEALWHDLSPKETFRDRDGREHPKMVPLDDKFFGVIEEFPNLRTVKNWIVFPEYRGSRVVGFTGARQIGQLKNLQILGMKLGVGPKDDLKLAPMPSLERVELDGVAPLHVDWESLARSPRLSTIVFHSAQSVDDATLASVAKLPHLSTVILDTGVFPATMSPLTAAGFESLAKAPGLQRLYAGVDRNSHPSQTTVLARELIPNVEVLPASIEIRPQRVMPAIPFVLFAAAIGIQLSSQFRGAFSRTMPRYALLHGLVGIALACAIVAWATWTWASLGISVTVALVAALAIVAAAIALMAPTAVDGVMPGGAMAGFSPLGQSIYMACWLSLMFASLHPQGRFQTIGQDYPWTLPFFVLVTIASIVFTVRTLSQVQGWSSTLNVAGHKAFGWADVRYQDSTWSDLFLGMKNQERGVDSLSEQGRVCTWWGRVRRWRLGNPPYRTMAFSIAMVGSMVGGASLVQIFTRGDWSLRNLSPPLAMSGPFLLLVIAGGRSSAWRMRIPVFSLELQRPGSRESMQYELMAAFALEFVSTAFVFALAVSGAFSLVDYPHVDWGLLPMTFLTCFLTGWLVATGLGSLIVLVNRGWLAFVLFVLSLLGITALIITVIVMTDTRVFPAAPSPERTVQLLQAALWVPMLCGGILAFVMGRRWLRLEIGTRA